LGFAGLYVPAAQVHHRDPLHRMTEKYLRYYYRQAGEMNAAAGKVAGSPHIWLGVPRYLWRKFLQNTFKYLLTRWTAPSPVWLKAEVQAAVAYGEICGLRHRLRSK
jgi:hypothetical protein